MKKITKFFGAACVAAGLAGGTWVYSEPGYFLEVSARANAAFAVDALMRFGATTNPPDFSRDPLWLASLHGSTEVVEALIDNGFDVNAWMGVALITAASEGHIETVELLVSKGANLNERGARGALTNAAASGHLDVVKFLIEAGADLEINQGAAAYRARLLGHERVAEYIESVQEHERPTLDFG